MRIRQWEPRGRTDRHGKGKCHPINGHEDPEGEKI